jgi:hypothetical protein
MKKLIFILAIATILSSCKQKCGVCNIAHHYVSDKQDTSHKYPYTTLDTVQACGAEFDSLNGAKQYFYYNDTLAAGVYSVTNTASSLCTVTN